MTEVLFYHLERARAADVLPTLLERTLAKGWRAVVRCADEEAVEALDGHLWTYRDDSFLPHGAGEHDPKQPVWLTASQDLPGARDVLFALAPAAFDAAALGDLSRAILMFEPEHAPAAREAWKAVKTAGHDATYWKQDADGRWVKAA